MIFNIKVGDRYHSIYKDDSNGMYACNIHTVTSFGYRRDVAPNYQGKEPFALCVVWDDGEFDIYETLEQTYKKVEDGTP